MENTLNNAQRCDSIRANPKFTQLVKSRSRLTWTLSALVLGCYYLFMLVVAFAPDILHSRLSDGEHLTLGIPVAAAVIILSWLLTGLYVGVANSKFDRLSEKLLEEEA